MPHRPTALSGSSSGQGQGNQSKGRAFTLFKKKEKVDDIPPIVDLKRAESHRIYDITREFGKCSFTRNSNFKFKVVKGEKVYLKKTAELKIEKYESLSQNEREGVRIGYKELNLADYLN